MSFDLYAENHQIPLTEFCDICMIHSDGSLAEPRPAGFEDFYRTLTVGYKRGVSATTAASIHFPVVHYFALFVAKCLLARKKVGALSTPDFAVLHRALEGDNTYSLGAIVARRLHLNKSRAEIHGGIFATRLAAHFEVEIRPHDFPPTKVYLDRAAMDHHHFTDNNSPDIPIPYNLVFSIDTWDIISLPTDTSPSYLLFQTLLPLFWTLTCMI